MNTLHFIPHNKARDWTVQHMALSLTHSWNPFFSVDPSFSNKWGRRQVRGVRVLHPPLFDSVLTACSGQRSGTSTTNTNTTIHRVVGKLCTNMQFLPFISNSYNLPATLISHYHNSKICQQIVSGHKWHPVGSCSIFE